MSKVKLIVPTLSESGGENNRFLTWDAPLPWPWPSATPTDEVDDILEDVVDILDEAAAKELTTDTGIGVLVKAPDMLFNTWSFWIRIVIICSKFFFCSPRN